MDWKPELEAVVGARHGGRIEGAVEQLESLASRFPNIAEIHAQLARGRRPPLGPLAIPR